MTTFLPFFISFFVSLVVAPLVIFFYKKKGWVDNPKKHKHAKVVHLFPVPRGGGIVVWIGVLAAGLFLLPLTQEIIGIMLGSLVLMIVGVIDDIYDISPYIRLATGTLAALLVIGSGVGIAYITNPFGPGVIHFDTPQLEFLILGQVRTIWILSDLIALVWIVWTMNIVNWSKGVDGQMPGFVAIAAIFLGLLSLRFSTDGSQIGTTILSFLVAGAFLGLLFWNYYPQKIMPGYGAGSLGGYFLAVLAILSGAKLATAFLVLAVPMADAIFTVLRRIIRGKSPFWGDRGHLHHKLMDVLGWNKRKIAFFYWITTLILGFISLQLRPGQKVFTMAVALALVFGFMIWVKLFITFSKQLDPDNG